MMFRLAAGGRHFDAIPLFACAAALALTLFGAEPGLRIEAIQARLFRSKTGALSEDVLAKEPQRLGNVIAGEDASVSTFVTVKLHVPRGGPAIKDIRVRLLVTEAAAGQPATKSAARGSKVVLDQSSVPGPPSPEGISYVGFWLARTGCTPLKLSATIPGVPAAKADAYLGFACYE